MRSFVNLVLLLVGVASHLCAIPFLGHEQESVGSSYRWKVLTAKEALRAGFTSLAVKTLEDVLIEKKSLSASELDDVYYDLASGYIALNQLENAKRVLGFISLPQRKASKYFLRQAIIESQLKNYSLSTEILQQCTLEELSQEDKGWYYFLRGMNALRKNDFSDAKLYYEKAQAHSVSEVQKAQFSAVQIQIPIIKGTVTEELAKGLEAEVTAREGSPYLVNDKYLIDYPVILNYLGEKNKAVKFIEKQLEYKLIAHSDYRERLLVLVALISGEDTDKGQHALLQVLKGPRGRSAELKKVSLFLLAKGSKAIQDPQTFQAFLDDLIVKKEISALLDEIYMLRAHLFLAEGKFVLAKKDAETILKELPGSPLISEAMRMLAFIAWKSEPSQYRTAANYLNQSRNNMSIDVEWAQVTRLVADCYFLNEDYEMAISFYKEALDKGEGIHPLGSVFYQLILSELKLENLAEATKYIESKEFLKVVDPESYWKAEWNLISAIRKKRGVYEAYERLSALLVNPSQMMQNSLLHSKFIWLQAKLSMEMGDLAKGLDVVERLIRDLESSDSTTKRQERDELLSNSLLLKGKILLKEEKVKQAVKVFDSLRENYPHSEAAILSFLEESRYYTSKNKTIDAQQRLNELIDRYPNNHNVPIALYEAALNAERRGSKSAYEEALGILERLAVKYPDDELMYYARLKQGDLLRKINDFSTAQLVYKNLLKASPKHIEYHRTSLSYADCLLADSERNKKSINEAIFILESIFNIPNAPIELQSEAGFKWAFGLEKKGDIDTAKEILLAVITRFLIKNPASNELQENGRYWISRSAFELGKLYEQTSEFKSAIQSYNYVIDYGLPGKVDAEAMINNLL